jgi:hypothetical protein
VSKTYWLLYPENRIVTAEKIQMWHLDAVSNGECEGDIDQDDIEGAIAQLEDAGLITVARVSQAGVTSYLIC